MTCRSFLLLAFSGAATATTSAQFVEDSTPIWTFQGAQNGDSFGWVSERVGDLDGDGFEDLGIGATGVNSGSGRLTVHSTGTGATLLQFDGAAGSLLGFDVDTAGDHDGDGVPDVLVGAPAAGAGSVVVVSGASGLELQRWTGEANGDQFGYGVAFLGDLDANGRPDYLVGAIGHASGAGRAYWMEAGSSAARRVHDGRQPGQNFGSGVGLVGDVDGDGTDDYVVGAMNAARGRAYVYSGATGARIHRLDAAATGGSFGQFFASGAGDVNADGTPDVFVGDFSDSSLGPTTGQAFLFSGRDGSLLRSYVGASSGAGMGPGRAAGDVDRDGHADLVVAEWTSGEGAPRGGKVSVYSGRDGSTLRTWTGDVRGATLGFDAHALGDIDGNGSVDFALSAASQGAGVVHVVSGGIELPAPRPGVAGVVNTFRGVGAFPSRPVYQVFGFDPGDLPLGPCGPSLLIRPPFFILRTPSDAHGHFETTALVPAALQGTTLLRQAIDPGACLSSPREDFILQ